LGWACLLDNRFNHPIVRKIEETDKSVEFIVVRLETAIPGGSGRISNLVGYYGKRFAFAGHDRLTRLRFADFADAFPASIAMVLAFNATVATDPFWHGRLRLIRGVMFNSKHYDLYNDAVRPQAWLDWLGTLTP
jgi:hypothetical protein